MQIPPLSQSPFRLSSHAQTTDGNRSDNTRLQSGISRDPAVSSATSRQDALALFERTLTMGYEKLQAKQGAVGQFAAFEPLTAGKVAGNILGFIERRLQMDVAEGATQEQLASRLEAGLAGFKKGFAEASEKLKALSMLSPDVEQDIGKTYDLVLTGVDALREKFLGGLVKNEPTTTPETTPQATRQQAYAALASSSYQYASASSFSFQLTTAEGDKVTISATSAQAFSGQYARGVAGNNESYTLAETMSASYSSTRESSWSIQGDLNDDEMQAIEELLGQINKLAGEFFNGNLDEAFNQALALGYDQQHITAFSLNLTQVEVQRVSTAYQQFNDAPIGENPGEHLLPVGKFVRDLLNALETANNFSEPETLLLDLSEKIVATDENETSSPAQRFRDFVEQVLHSMKPV